MSYCDCRMVNIAFIISCSRIKCTHYPISEVSELRALEYFSCNKNQLSELPIALGNCQNLIEFVIDENYSLREIPPRIFALKYLTYLSANSEFQQSCCSAIIPFNFNCVYLPGCNLYYLPYFLSRNEELVVKIFENILLTHYPLAFERHIPSMFDNLSKYHTRYFIRNKFYKMLYRM